MKTLIGIQDEYIQSVLAGVARWSHRKAPRWSSYRYGGHFSRIVRGAHSKASGDLARIGFVGEAAEQVIAQAYDMARLEMDAE